MTIFEGNTILKPSSAKKAKPHAPISPKAKRSKTKISRADLCGILKGYPSPSLEEIQAMAYKVPPNRL